MIKILMQSVEEYNGMVSEEKRLDWSKDVVSNINDLQDEKELEKAYAGILNEIIKVKMLNRVSK